MNATTALRLSQGLTVGLVLLLATACTKVEEITVEGAKLGEADGTMDPPPGTDLALVPGEAGPPVFKLAGAAVATGPDGALPAEALPTGTVRLAVDRSVPFSAVKPVLEQLYARDGKVIALVTNTGLKRKLQAMELFAAGDKAAEATQVAAYANGKMCVNLPGVDRAKCSQGRLGNIDRPTTRSIVREAYQAETLTYAVVSVDPALTWGDLVRAVDGARTCCGKDVTMRVELRERLGHEFHIPEE